MTRRFQKVLWVLAAVAIAWIGFRVYSEADRRMVASILHLNAPPRTLRVVACDSPVTTDVITTCSIEIEPREFPTLVTGYPFQERPVTGTIYRFTRFTSAIEPMTVLTIGDRNVGPEFPVAVEYFIEPKEFRYGEWVRILADAPRRRAIVDLYIEWVGALTRRWSR